MKRLLTLVILILFLTNQSLLVHAATTATADNSCHLAKEKIELSAEINYLDLDTYQERFNLLQEDIRLEEERKAEEARKAREALILANYNNAWNVAYSLVGYGGDCWYIANLFSQRFRGHSIGSRYQVSYDEAIPGDLIFYSNGGIGVQHFATYLGDGKALQGNYNGTTIIGSVWLKGASSPIFYRVN